MDFYFGRKIAKEIKKLSVDRRVFVSPLTLLQPSKPFAPFVLFVAKLKTISRKKAQSAQK